MTYTAHKAEDGTIQSVQEHLTGVAKLASTFGKAFDAEKHAYRTGLLHDVGKYAEDVQKRMNDPEHVPKVNHTSAGALEAFKQRDLPGTFAIAAHHGGLMDVPALKSGKLQYKPKDYSAFKQEVFPETGMLEPAWTRTDPKACGFYTRMLFSCLVDADYLDTEAFMRKQCPRQAMGEPLPVLLERLQNRVNQWYPPKGALNAYRCSILDDCIAAADGDKGLYSLTVPTGGGKTTASLMFALKHATHPRHPCDRVIYVVPYTSIIEQNAAVFSEILGSNNVLEHHSNVEVTEDGQDEELHAAAMRKRLATENWDAPVIVTTAVQFFESLFGARSSQCRKLHHIANSVIIFDEAQMLPLNFLRPCVFAMAELVKHYHVTAVLCTATQPSLNQLLAEYLPEQPIREIVHDREALYQAFRRVTYRNEGQLTAEALSERLQAQTQALCIVNSRKMAQQLYDALPQDSRFHLSTWMTPADRRCVIDTIRMRLQNDLPCHLVSTSLIEAGVDLDFPTVWREEAGLDSILQAGGRCNREGKRSREESIVHVFRLQGHSCQHIRQQIQAYQLATEQDQPMDALSSIQLYFDALLKVRGSAIDQQSIMEQQQQLLFQTVSQRFHLIDDNQTVTLYLPTASNAKALSALRDGSYTRETLRRLQQDSISLFQNDAQALVNAGRVERTRDDFHILTDVSLYDRQRGLMIHSEVGLASFA